MADLLVEYSDMMSLAVGGAPVSLPEVTISSRTSTSFEACFTRATENGEFWNVGSA